MHGCVLARRWQPALSLLSAMRRRRIASEMAVNIGIAACEDPGLRFGASKASSGC